MGAESGDTSWRELTEPPPEAVRQEAVLIRALSAPGSRRVVKLMCGGPGHRRAQSLGEIWMAGTQLVLRAVALDVDALNSVVTANKDAESKATSMISGSAHIPANAFENQRAIRLSPTCAGGRVWCPKHGSWEPDPRSLKRAVGEARVLRSVRKIGLEPPAHR